MCSLTVNKEVMSILCLIWSYIFVCSELLTLREEVVVRSRFYDGSKVKTTRCEVRTCSVDVYL